MPYCIKNTNNNTFLSHTKSNQLSDSIFTYDFHFGDAPVILTEHYVDIARFAGNILYDIFRTGGYTGLNPNYLELIEISDKTVTKTHSVGFTVISYLINYLDINVRNTKSTSSIIKVKNINSKRWGFYNTTSYIAETDDIVLEKLKEPFDLWFENIDLTKIRKIVYEMRV